MRVLRAIPLLLSALVVITACSGSPSNQERLQSMLAGVWVSDGGAYTVWTASHYFVVSAMGDSSSANIYCGESQVRYTDRGLARKQNLRFRQVGSTKPQIISDFSMFDEGPDSTVAETPLQIDESLFTPGACHVEEGVIYDSITESTGEYILLSTCNGDRVKIFADGRSVYMPAQGGESWSYRIESF